MSGRKSIWGIFGLTVSAGLLAAAVSVLLYTFHAGRMQFEMINAICGEVVEQDPEARTIIAAALKEYTGENDDGTAEENLLESLGYRISDFSGIAHGHGFLFIGMGVLAGGLLFACTWLRRNRRESLRIRALTEYLEQANTGSAPILSAAGEDTGEDDFSRLADGIYKTVTSLCQARETAVRARNGFAENLSNIAHQIKTPITAISLSVQTLLLLPSMTILLFSPVRNATHSCSIRSSCACRVRPSPSLTEKENRRSFPPPSGSASSMISCPVLCRCLLSG